jgi:hypothetical protein
MSLAPLCRFASLVYAFKDSKSRKDGDDGDVVEVKLKKDVMGEWGGVCGCCVIVSL